MMQLPRKRSAGAVCLLLSAGALAAAQTTSAPTDKVSGTQQPTAQAASGTGSGQTQTGATRVHGTVADPDGAAIPGATIVFTGTKGPERKVTSGPDGGYSVSLVPGTYNLVVSMQGFSTYSVQSLKIAPVASLTVDAKLQIGQQEVVINVDANAVSLSVDPDSNASSTVIEGKDLEALSDDPDELSNELSALAGPAAGPNGGQIYVDGFTGGQLPPKSSIREIRINQNPFSAQYDRIGYGRVEVFTKPGTDKYHGNFQINGNPSQFNTPNPLSGAYQPPYHTIFMFGSLTGPINKSTSFSIGGSHRDIEDNAFTNVPSLYTTAPGATTPCPPGTTTGCGIYATSIFTHLPQIRTDIAPRFDFALGEKNVLTTRFQYVQNDSTNAGIGGFVLPSSAYNQNNKSFEVQLSDTQTWSSKLINETRFEYERERQAYVPLTNTPSISVGGNFSYGGASVQSTSNHQDHIEVQNYTSIALSKNFIRVGGRLRIDRQAQYAAGNTNGSFTYTDIASYIANRPSQFSLSVLHTNDVNFTYEDLGLYAEDDWKIRPNVTLSYGLRYETQNHLSDHHDFAPRLSLSYGLGSAKGTPKTVVRAGFGMFYDRFGANYILNTTRYNGIAESLYTVNAVAPGCTPQSFAASTPTSPSNPCTSGATASGGSLFTTANGTIAPTLRTPYLIEFAGGFDQQAGRHGTVSVNYIHSQGVHQLAQENVNCVLGANGICAPASAVNNQYFSEGAFTQDQLLLNGRVQTAKWLSFFGFYSLNFAKGDSSGAGSTITVPYNIKADYGRTTFDTRNRLFFAGSVTLPYLIQFSPFMIAQSGSPYNVTQGFDTNQDSYYNERPYRVAAGTTAPASNPYAVQSIPGCGTFAEPGFQPSGSEIAPINACTGPALFTFNMRLTKAFGFGEKIGAAAPGGQGGPGGPGGGGRGGGRGGPGGPGGFGGGGASTGRRYSMALGVNIQNLFNNRDLANPVSTLTSQNFGQTLQLAGGPFTQQSAVRRLSLQASFNF